MRRALLAVCLAGVSLGAQSSPPQQTPPPQQPQQPQQPTFRTAIDAVTVDVIVTDKDGKPVTDLTAADFEIKENNKVQTIDSFKRIDLEDDRFDPDPVRAAPILSLESMEREAARDDVRLITIFLDDYHTRRSNAMAVREKLARFVSELDPKDMVALMYPLTPVTALTYTRDHAGIAQAIMKFDGRKYDYDIKYPQEEIYYRLTKQQIEDLRNSIVIDAIAGLNVYMGTLRQGRKTVLMVSEGMTSLLPIEISSSGVFGSDPNPASADAINRDRASFRASADLLMRMRDIFEAANRTNTSVYTLDPRGLATSEFDLSDRAVPYTADRRALNEAMDTLRVIAEETDGRAIVNRNDPLPQLRQMLTDSSAYYLLGYTSTEAPRDGKFHEIKLSVKRKGVDIRYRKGYWAMSADNVERASRGPVKNELPPDLADALERVAEPERGRTVRTWVGFARGSDGKATATLVWESGARAGVGAGDVPTEVSVLATSAAGDLLYRGKVTRDAGATRPAGRVTFAAPPGEMTLRMTAHGDSGLVDSEDRTVTVPDFTKVGPAVGTPALFRARTALEVQQLRTSASAIPTPVRTFDRTEQLLVRFHAYAPGGASPEIHARIRNSLGDVMSSLPAPVAGTNGTYDLPLSLGALASGTYILEIEAAAGETSARAVVGFRIS